MVNLDTKHHTLIQTLLSRGPLKEREVLSLFKAVSSAIPGSREKDIHGFIGSINRELDFVQLEARASRNQYDGDVYYAVVNKVADEPAKLGTQYSLPQIAFFKSIMEGIVLDPSAKGHISNIEALNIRLDSQVRQDSQGDQNLPLAFKQFSMAQKEKTLEDLIKDRWLCSLEDGEVGLGARAFIELKSLFKNLDVPFCEVCNEAGIRATICQNEECSVRMHDYCAKRKFELPQVSKVCPTCGIEWDCSGLKNDIPDLNEDDPSQGNVKFPRVEKRKRTSRSSVHLGN